jgi:hypothetical protein
VVGRAGERVGDHLHWTTGANRAVLLIQAGADRA